MGALAVVLMEVHFLRVHQTRFSKTCLEGIDRTLGNRVCCHYLRIGPSIACEFVAIGVILT
jgi:hypothetical protein